MTEPRAALSHRLPYRPEIDGLRALAVVPVILFHAGIPGFAGGYVGVDVFFVISGYLITSVILADLAAERFTFLDFYERRARRILPALLVVMLATVPFAWMWLDPHALSEFGKSLGAAAVFVSNLLFLRDTNYFGQAAELKPLLHTWSLGVEEQFYLLFPLGLVLVWRRWRAATGLCLAAAGLLSLCLSGYLTWRASPVGFYLLPSRGWELLVGAAIAHRHATAPASSLAPTGSALTAVGLVAILWAVSPYVGLETGPFSRSVVATLGACLVVWCGATPGLAYRLLSHAVPVRVGAMSYSLYLIHQPVLAMARALEVNRISTRTYLILALACCVAAALLWRVVEQPFRRAERIASRWLWRSVTIGAGLAVLIGASCYVTGGWPGRFSAQDIRVLQVKTFKSVDRFALNGVPCANRLPSDGCRLGYPGAEPSWALVGDSHAAALAPALDERLQGSQLAGQQLTRFSCLYVGDAVLVSNNPVKQQACHLWTTEVHARILSPTVRDVVVAGRYVNTFEGVAFDNGEGGRESTGQGIGRVLDDRRSVAAIFQRAITELLAAGKRVHLVYPIPEVGWDVPIRLFKLHALWHRDDPVTTSYAVFLRRTQGVRDLFDALGDLDGLSRVRPETWLCDSTLAGRCVTALDDQVLYFDDDHPSYAGAVRVIDHLSLRLPTASSPARSR